MRGLARIVTWILLIKALVGERRAARDAGKEGATLSTRPASHARREAAPPPASRGGSGGIPPQRKGEPGPDTPLELEPADWKATIKRTVKEIKDDRITLAAAGMAYYFFLAIFPALIAFIGLLGLLEVDVSGIEEAIQETVPGSAADFLIEPISNAQNASRGASLVATISGIAVALWSASAGMVGLQGALNIAYDVPHDRKFVGKRLIAFALLIATGLLGGVPSPFFTFGESLFFTILGWVLTVVAVGVLFSIYYYLAPNREKPTWQWVSVGGVVGAILWIVASVGFVAYVNAYGESSYSRTYGSAAGVIVLILWLFLSSLAVLVGGELNAEVERQSERSSHS